MSDFPHVETLIPHRRRWRLVEEIVEEEPGRLVCIGHFSAEYADGHFPERLVVPGVALLEGLAQTMLCLSKRQEPEVDGIPFLAGFDRVRFRRPVFPPQTVHFEVVVKERRAGMTMANGTARVDGRRVCTAKLLGTVLPVPP